MKHTHVHTAEMTQILTLAISLYIVFLSEVSISYFYNHKNDLHLKYHFHMLQDDQWWDQIFVSYLPVFPNFPNKACPAFIIKKKKIRNTQTKWSQVSRSDQNFEALERVEVTTGILGGTFMEDWSNRNTKLGTQLLPKRICCAPAWKGQNPDITATGQDTCTTAVMPALWTTTAVVSPSFNTTPHTHLDFPKKAETF